MKKITIMPRYVGRYANRHAGEDAWLFGKGPSFEHVDWSQVGPLRVCINDTVWAVPQPTYVLALDRPKIELLSRRLWPDGCTPILPEFACHFPCLENYGVFFKDCTLHDQPEHWPRDECEARDQLLVLSVTTVTALHFLWLAGVSRVFLAGIDGAGGYGRDWGNGPAGDGAYGDGLYHLKERAKMWQIELCQAPMCRETDNKIASKRAKTC